MLVTLHLGSRREDVLRTLRETESAAQNTNNHPGFHGSTAYSRLTSYLEWATNSVRMLDHRVRSADVNRLVCICGYEHLVSAVGSSLTGADIDTQRVLNGLVDHENIKDLDEQIRQWPKDTIYTVADTSVYIEHDHEIPDLDFGSVLDGWVNKHHRALSVEVRWSKYGST